MELPEDTARAHGPQHEDMRTGKGDREPMDEVPPPPVPGLFIRRESLLPSPRRGKGNREAVDEVPSPPYAQPQFPEGTTFCLPPAGLVMGCRH